MMFRRRPPWPFNMLEDLLQAAADHPYLVAFLGGVGLVVVVRQVIGGTL